MKPYQIFLVFATFVLAALALLLLARIAWAGWVTLERLPQEPDEQNLPQESSEPALDGADLVASPDSDVVVDVIPVDVINADFPMTQDAFNLANIGDGSLVYQTQMSLEEVMKFYRDEYAAKGYTEREELTNVSDGNFKMSFDGDPSGKAVVIQSEDLSDGGLLITIRLEDV